MPPRKTARTTASVCGSRGLAALLAFVLVLGGAAVPAARADLPDDEKERLFRAQYDQAESEYNAKNYQAAVPRLQAAFAIEPLPQILFNIAQAYRKLFLYSDARVYYELYRSTAKDIPQPEQASLDRHIAEMRELERASQTPKVIEKTKFLLLRSEKPPPRWLRPVGLAAGITGLGALGGGIAIQHRMAYQGEYFLARYGAEATRSAPPIRKMLAAGLHVGGGTDATRVASYNPWVGLSWLVTGRTVGGLELNRPEDRLSRHEALRLYTRANGWFSGEHGQKGVLAPGYFGDLAVLSEDYFGVPEERIRSIESVLTVVGGRIVHAAQEFGGLAPPLPPASPSWSPPASFGGYGGAAARARQQAARAAPPLFGGCSCAVF